jgi:hypothetical protein
MGGESYYNSLFDYAVVHVYMCRKDYGYVTAAQWKSNIVAEVLA